MGDPEFPALVASASCAATGVDPANLIFEITETAAVADMDQARRVRREPHPPRLPLRARRLRRRLRQLLLPQAPADLDYLKIDGDFIRELTRTPTDQLVVQAIVDVARGLGMKTIAEFVGDEETVELLREYGVDLVQGYHTGRPAPVSELGAQPAD